MPFRKSLTVSTIGAGLTLVSAAAIASANGTANAGTGTRVRLEEVSRTITIPAGKTYSVSSQCAVGEAVTSGSATSWPPAFTVARSNVFWDGVHPGGWTITFKNTTSTSVMSQVGVSALCIAPGFMTN